MTFRPTGVPVTGVPGIPMVGYNQTIVGQPVTMVPMMQPTMIGVPVRNVQQMVQARVTKYTRIWINSSTQKNPGLTSYIT